ncbi:hypothetical protein [Azospirillum soli]|uniref:hypothetical protein n=1 Tax=Azospirillum soli TaxID=1304799 RepID=UPI001AE63BC7|nr:hypothetical protein [Azospirillum soli]MBP2316060.1 hypothetical protein [Azospirillum soli]
MAVDLFGQFAASVEAGEAEKAARMAKGLFHDLARETRWNPAYLLTMLGGLVEALTTGALTEPSYQARLRTYIETDNRFNEFVAWLTPAYKPPQNVPPAPGVLGVADPAVLENSISTLRRDGYHLFEKRVPDEVMVRLESFALQAPAKAIYPERRPSQDTAVDLTNKEVDGFQLDAQAVLDCPDVQALLMDPSFWSVARSYLGCEPVCIGATMRWSVPSARLPSDSLAQFYHWDAGWLNWLNFFFYVTDCPSPEYGPHVYVRGTHVHGAKPAELRQRFYARISDADIEQIYKRENIIPVTGPRGSVFAGDTRCWHKGLHPTGHHRLTLQFSFVSTPLLATRFFDRKLLFKNSHTEPFKVFVRENRDRFSPLYYDWE